MAEMTNKVVMDRLIAHFYVGSQAYGTNTATSDFDEGGVCIPNIDVYLGSVKFDQANSWLDENGDKKDKTIYSLDKAVHLMLDNNPNMLDYLYIPERCYLKSTPEWERILAVRDEFISKKCMNSFTGYAHSQLKRISTHRAYLLNPVGKPDRKAYGLPEKHVFPDTQYEIIAKLSTDYVDFDKRDDFYREMSKVIDNECTNIFSHYIDPSLSQIVMGDFKKGQKEFLGMFSSLSGVFLKDEYVDKAKKELSYLSAYKNWKSYQDWQTGRNSKRADLETKCGYDSKHASHCLRLCRMGVEILEGKGVNVDRTHIDAEQLLDIRLGNWKYEKVMELVDPLFLKMKELYNTSSLPTAPNKDLIINIKHDIILKYVFGK